MIHEYSSCNASTSVETTVHSTFAADITIAWVRGCSSAVSAKYEFNRERRLLALPT